jgi:predicted RNA-binding Zn-ribbon protein involved in translation (DUF1610 family)
MTTETRTSIEPKDISAVEFECRKCGTKTIRKIDNNFTTPITCGNCSDVWIVNNNSPEAQELTGFIRMLEYYSKHEFRYALRFQIPTGDNE